MKKRIEYATARYKIVVPRCHSCAELNIKHVVQFGDYKPWNQRSQQIEEMESLYLPRIGDCIDPWRHIQKGIASRCEAIVMEGE